VRLSPPSTKRGGRSVMGRLGPPPRRAALTGALPARAERAGLAPTAADGPAFTAPSCVSSSFSMPAFAGGGVLLCPHCRTCGVWRMCRAFCAGPLGGPIAAAVGSSCLWAGNAGPSRGCIGERRRSPAVTRGRLCQSASLRWAEPSALCKGAGVSGRTPWRVSLETAKAVVPIDRRPSRAKGAPPANANEPRPERAQLASPIHHYSTHVRKSQVFWPIPAKIV
jgi:hypothetical protein